jgi:hypothetical protein
VRYLFGASQQVSGVIAQMIFDKTRDEKVAVVVTRVAAVNQRMAYFFAHRLQLFWLELFGFEIIGLTLIDK